jgi:hypothetical protein
MRFAKRSGVGRPPLFAILVLGTSGLPFAQVVAQRSESATPCEAAGPLVRLPELVEASGIAASRRESDRLWAHNDSVAVLFALDGRGSVTNRVRVSGAPVRDLEAIAAGPCPAGSCLYLADIGDNAAVRNRISIYRLPEPASGTNSVTASESLHATYPDGPHDAETFLIAPDGRMFVVTKGDRDPVTIYRFPGDFRSGATVRLERVGQPRDSGKTKGSERVTDGAFSPDGAWIALRTNTALSFYRAAELTSGKWNEVRRIDLKRLGEPQGEGVALGADNFVYLVGESGVKTRGGTFARFKCVPQS